jgi:hypothetical protein
LLICKIFIFYRKKSINVGMSKIEQGHGINDILSSEGIRLMGFFYDCTKIATSYEINEAEERLSFHKHTKYSRKGSTVGFNWLKKNYRGISESVNNFAKFFNEMPNDMNS